jgi:hypothetical protein
MILAFVNKRKRIFLHILYWLVAALFLAQFIGKGDASFGLTLFTVALLLPVAIATSYTFNYFLFPRYLLTNQIWKFALYGSFVFVLSIYLESLVILLTFIYLANYNYSNMNPLAADAMSLGVGLYLVVFLSTLIYLMRRWTHPEPDEIKYLHVTIDRAKQKLAIENIEYIESLDNYVKIHLPDEVIITKEKISNLAAKLPTSFIRIHRSFLVNKDKIVSAKKDSITLSSTELPISRTYKKEVSEKLV